MDYQLDLLGGAPKPVAPLRVPSVTFYPRALSRKLGREHAQCGHCQMNARRFRDGKPVEGWSRESDVKILSAFVLITQRDGSTLSLCDQHAREHEERGETR